MATAKEQGWPQPTGHLGWGRLSTGEGQVLRLTSEPQELASVQDHGWRGGGQSMEGRGEESWEGWGGGWPQRGWHPISPPLTEWPSRVCPPP